MCYHLILCPSSPLPLVNKPVMLLLLLVHTNKCYVFVSPQVIVFSSTILDYIITLNLCKLLELLP